MLLNLEELYIKYRMKIRGVIHIGAHYGGEFYEFQKYNIENVIMFEPLSNNFKILSERLKNENVKLINKALGNENKMIEMYTETANNSQSSSILKPSYHTIQYPDIKFDGKELVEMSRLDDVIENKHLYNFINIDVQGYELEVFKGSVKILENIDYIIAEINNTELYEGCVNVIELDKFLEQFNFIRVETNSSPKTWGDALYIKK